MTLTVWLSLPDATWELLHEVLSPLDEDWDPGDQVPSRLRAGQLLAREATQELSHVHHAEALSHADRGRAVPIHVTPDCLKVLNLSPPEVLRLLVRALVAEYRLACHDGSAGTELWTGGDPQESGE